MSALSSDYLLDSCQPFYSKNQSCQLLQHEQTMHVSSPPLVGQMYSTFPSPTSSSESLSSPTPQLKDSLHLGPNALMVLQSISAMYQAQQQQQQQQQPQQQPQPLEDEQRQQSWNGLLDTIDLSFPYGHEAPFSFTGDVTSMSFCGVPSVYAPNLNEKTLSSDGAEHTESPAKPKSTRAQRQLECFNCQVTKTPLWRRTPDRAHSLCNACGLYFKQYGSHRPLHVRQKHSQSSAKVQKHQSHLSHATKMVPNPGSQRQETAPGAFPESPVPNSTSQPMLFEDKQARGGMASDSDQPLYCSNCHQTSTPLWRKNSRGEAVCNACGLYAKLHNRSRPVMMRKQSTQKRRRNSEQVKSPTGNTDEQSNAQATWFDHQDDLRFKQVLNSMPIQQQHEFLAFLEHRCAVLRSILFADLSNGNTNDCQS